MTDTKLTKKQEKFVDIYTETGNATEAAMQAYDCTDRKSAGVIGAQNLNKVSIEEAIRTKALKMRDRVIDMLTQTDAIAIALDSALQDIDNPDKSARSAARNFIKDLAKTFQSQEQTKTTTNNKQINNYLYPKK